MSLVLADEVLLEHGDVAPGGLNVEMAEEGGTDVDRQAVVDQLGGEQPAKSCGVKVIPRKAGFRSASASQRRRSMPCTVAVEMTARLEPICRWNRNGRAGLQTLSRLSKRESSGIVRPPWVWRRTIRATTWN